LPNPRTVAVGRKPGAAGNGLHSQAETIHSPRLSLPLPRILSRTLETGAAGQRRFTSRPKPCPATIAVNHGLQATRRQSANLSRRPKDEQYPLTGRNCPQPTAQSSLTPQPLPYAGKRGRRPIHSPDETVHTPEPTLPLLRNPCRRSRALAGSIPLQTLAVQRKREPRASGTHSQAQTATSHTPPVGRTRAAGQSLASPNPCHRPETRARGQRQPLASRNCPQLRAKSSLTPQPLP
jgi:hypothetical protein